MLLVEYQWLSAVRSGWSYTVHTADLCCPHSTHSTLTPEYEPAHVCRAVQGNLCLPFYVLRSCFLHSDLTYCCVTECGAQGWDTYKSDALFSHTEPTTVSLGITGGAVVSFSCSSCLPYTWALMREAIFVYQRQISVEVWMTNAVTELQAFLAVGL